ncbi:glutamine amidotransferase [Rhodoligotrophos appendicifer]|uniref:imidazole glycerol phosphate synthase subunit HisH n=1 Tax=Rhodoligotrophos appendicifer TaxID=987056 RepID=UPI00117F327D|nr:imidazole glycerol phosphate synthase subunit HisH [Rhodoligotrophos appendicifer]
MRVAIVDYGSGNLRSAHKAFERAAREAEVDAKIEVTSNPRDVAEADRVVLPGVGAFADCRAGILAIEGMWETLEDVARTKARPFFGICVGMQLMAERGLEFGTWEGFGWIKGDVVKIDPVEPELKVPHMGWNSLTLVTDHPVVQGLQLGEEGLHAYFVHSYRLKAADRSQVVAETEYGGAVTAIVADGSVVGTQFHPEKSQTLGLALIGNFLKWRP